MARNQPTSSSVSSEDIALYRAVIPGRLETGTVLLFTTFSSLVILGWVFACLVPGSPFTPYFVAGLGALIAVDAILTTYLVVFKQLSGTLELYEDRIAYSHPTGGWSLSLSQITSLNAVRNDNDLPALEIHAQDGNPRSIRFSDAVTFASRFHELRASH